MLYFNRIFKSRQAHWAQTLSKFNIKIKYKTGKANAAADTLSHRDQDTRLQRKTKTQLRQCCLLSDEQVEKPYLELDVGFIGTFDLAEKLLCLNRDDPSLERLRKQVNNNFGWYFQLRNGILLFKNDRLVVLDVENIRTSIVKEAHDQPLTAHLRAKKTIQLLASRY